MSQRLTKCFTIISLLIMFVSSVKVVSANELTSDSINSSQISEYSLIDSVEDDEIKSSIKSNQLTQKEVADSYANTGDSNKDLSNNNYLNNASEASEHVLMEHDETKSSIQSTKMMEDDAINSYTNIEDNTKESSENPLNNSTDFDILKINSPMSNIANKETVINGFSIQEDKNVGQSYVITASGSSTNGVQYRYLAYNLDTGKWIIIKEYSDSTSVNWIPEQSGSYIIEVHVRDVKSTKAYEQIGQQKIDVKSTTRLNSLIVSEGGYVGKDYIITASGSSANGVQYRYLAYNLDTGKWITIKEYSDSTSVNWVPEQSGSYIAEVHIRDARSTKAYEQIGQQRINVKSTSLDNFRITESGYVNENYEIVASGSSANGVQYKYLAYYLDTGKWITIKEYSDSTSVNWVPEQSGSYIIEVHIRDARSTKAYEQIGQQRINVKSTSLDNFTITGGGYVGKDYIITASGSSANGVQYKYLAYNLDTGKWITIKEYSDSTSVNWVPEQSGNYIIEVHIRDAKSAKAYEQIGQQNINVRSTTKLNSFTVSEGGYVGQNYVIVANGSSAYGVQYRYLAYNLETGKWITIKDYSDSTSVNWVPEQSGSYILEVHIKDIKSTKAYEQIGQQTIDVKPSVIYYYTEYGYTLEEILNIQANKLPQTDKYRNQPVYIESSRVDEYRSSSAMVKQNVRIRTSPDTSSSTNIYMSTTSPVEVEILDKNISGSSYEGSTVWYKIKHNNNSNLYVHSKLIDETGKTYYKVNSNALVKSEMNVNSHSYGTIKSGDTINIRKTSSSYWYEVIGYGAWRNPTRQDLEQYVNPNNWIDTKTETINTNMYQFLVLSGSTGVTASQLNTELQGKDILAGKGSAFVEASRQNNINEAYLMTHAFLETGNGTSTLAKGVAYNGRTVYNVYGIGALDQDPINLGAKRAYEEGWFTVEDAIIGGASWIARNYINNPTYKQNTLYKMRWNPATPGQHQYATDIGWAVKQTKSMDIMVEICLRNEIPMVFDIPTYK